MTDKQIIIDGVDVADCEHINACDKKMKCVILQDDVCETNPYCEGFNCYFKQLKRKEQECEQLRKTMHKDFCSHYVLGECSQEHHNNCVGRNQCIKDLEQECEALKAELEQYKKSKQASYEQLQARCNELEFGIRKLQKQFGIEILYCKATGESTFRSTEILKLKRTLTEIKEIAEIKQKQSVFVGETVFEQILQKISEVLDENI